MTSDIETGGRRVLDIAARSEAIHLTWIQSYLKIGIDRPTWAYVADEILGSDVPGEIKALADDPNARINQFLQTWHSRKNNRKGPPSDEEDTLSIPNDLRTMLKVANKYGVRLEATTPAVEVKRCRVQVGW